jgi:ethanolaminephosphotransferase
VITLIGFFCTLVPFFLLFNLYGTDFEGPVPAWWCFLEAIMYFLYRLLDEMDGKQARKTGNSSPVGLMFDHGCDSFSTALMAMMMGKMMQVGNGTVILWILVAVTQSFHFCTLEEYYIGGLYLGPFNGVTDGSAAIIGIFLITGIFGYDCWLASFNIPGFGLIRASHIVAYLILVSQIVAVCLK